MAIAIEGILVAAGSVAAALLGHTLVQHWWPSHRRQELNDVAGFVFAILGLIYGVLLGFMVIVVWQQFDAAETTVNMEANELADIAHLNQQWPEPAAQQVQRLSIAYAQRVIQDEWPLLARGKASPQAESALMQLRTAVLGMSPQTIREQVLYEQEIVRVQELSNHRRLRIFYSNGGLPPVLWGTMWVGGVIVVAYCYLFGLDNTKAHAGMIAALVVVIAGALFVVHAINHPFAGDIRVQPEAFQSVLDELQSTQR